MRKLSLSWLTLGVAGCAGQFVVKGAPGRTFDAVIVPGCPSLPDGRLSRCQMGRALWAAVIWERGWARGFIASGGAVHTPHVEAEALAAGMAALGVPAEKIWIEPEALHTDENMYFSLRVARAAGLSRLAVASTRGHAAYGCRMLADWGHAECAALVMDESAVAERHRRSPRVLEAVRITPVEGWVALDDREEAIWRATGRRRPASWILYPYLGWLRVTGQSPWIPPHTPRAPVATWDQAKRSSRTP
jgi:hypothetical protein